MLSMAQGNGRWRSASAKGSSSGRTRPTRRLHSQTSQPAGWPLARAIFSAWLSSRAR